ncbi:MAG: sortase, partial [Leptolinea sp.]|nr:sortase [Leptolinea sp.]
DRGAVDEATANNEVVITFLVSVPDALNLVNNQAPSLTDTDGDGDFADETTSASESISNRSTWYRFARPGRGTTGIDIDAKILPASGFAPGLRTNLNGKPDGIYRTYNALDMEIPKLGLKTSILGLSALNGKWDVSWLGDRLAYLHESAFPTWEGNSVITGHVYNSDGNPGPFNQLHTLHYGDRIVIHAYDQVYLYEVREMQAVSPDDIESTFKHQKNSWITLLTCQGYNPDRGEYDSRLLVRAVLMEKQ